MEADPRAGLDKVLHDLPSGWEWEWLTNVLDVEGGTQPPASEFVDSPRPDYVRLVQIRDFESDSHATYIPNSSKWRKCRASDVLIARYGASLGRICTGLEGAYNVALAKVVPTERIHLPFAYQLLKSNYFQGPLLAGGGRSAQAGFNKGGLSVIPVPVPPVPEQTAIADVLGALDQKIDLDRRMGETLESLAGALFRSWFVDFDPVRAKAECRATGLPGEVDGLFPDSFDVLEGGEVPGGWSTQPLGVAAMQSREVVNPGQEPAEAFNHYSLPAFDAGQTSVREFGDSIKSNKWKVPPGAVLLSKLNPQIERVWLVDVASGERAICSTEFIVLLPKTPYSRSFVYCLSRSRRFREGVASLVTGTSNSHQRANAESLLGLRFVSPPEPLLSVFNHIAEPLLQRALLARRESRTLAKARDALLPRLISGDLRLDVSRSPAGPPP